MKSSIKVDMTLDGKPIINLNVYDGWEDLRDKALNMFVNTLRPHGRLCFIDSSGSKNSGSSGGESPQSHYYAITPINPDDYELLVDELNLLIKERDDFLDAESTSSFKYSEHRKEARAKYTEQEIRERMNY